MRPLPLPSNVLLTMQIIRPGTGYSLDSGLVLCTSSCKLIVSCRLLKMYRLNSIAQCQLYSCPTYPMSCGPVYLDSRYTEFSVQYE
jgi:hypothetical protein